jgi:hypothetical protein
MELSSEILASIVNISGKWAVSLASTPTKGHIIEPSGMSDELKRNYQWAFGFLEAQMREYLSASKMSLR